MNTTKSINIQSNYLWFLTLTYSMIIVMANWFDARLIKLFGLVTDAGTIIFPLTFLFSDLITEVYGYKHARRAIWFGFLFNIIFILYGQLIIHLPSPDFETHNFIFDTLLAINARIISASIISYLCSEPLNAMILAKCKIKTHGRYMGFRFAISTFFASGMDSILFGMIAFYGTMNNKNLISLILVMWLIKVAIEILGLPLSIKLANKLKKIDQIDIYDNYTNFNIFQFDTNYSPISNEFRNKIT